MFSCVYTCIKTDSQISFTQVIILSVLTNLFSSAALGVACSMGLQGQGRLWWLGRWLTSAVRVTRKFPFLCERELTASANGWENQNDSSAFSLTRLLFSACFASIGSKSQSNVMKCLCMCCLGGRDKPVILNVWGFVYMNNSFKTELLLFIVPTCRHTS